MNLASENLPEATRQTEENLITGQTLQTQPANEEDRLLIGASSLFGNSGKPGQDPQRPKFNQKRKKS